MRDRNARVIALFGPTAVGKTEVALAVARLLREQGIDPVAVSADAFQLYRGLEVTSGAPSPAQRQELEHLLVSSHDLTEEMSAGRFADIAHEAIDEAIAAGRQPIVISGSGLYMQAALTELDMRPPAGNGAAPVAREADALHERLREVAPTAAAQVTPGDRYRTERALALAEAGARPEPGEAFWEAPLRHPTLRFALSREREELYRRIGERVEAMAAAGAADEVRAAGKRASATARKIIGFEELPAGGLDQMAQRTRRYAKRQATWARRLPEARSINLSATGIEGAAKIVVEALGQGRE